MKSNVGGIDRTLRLIVGLALLSAGLYYQSWWGLIGLIPVFTAVLSFCPAYLPLGLSSCRKPASNDPAKK